MLEPCTHIWQPGASVLDGPSFRFCPLIALDQRPHGQPARIFSQTKQKTNSGGTSTSTNNRHASSLRILQLPHIYMKSPKNIASNQLYKWPRNFACTTQSIQKKRMHRTRILWAKQWHQSRSNHQKDRLNHDLRPRWRRQESFRHKAYKFFQSASVHVERNTVQDHLWVATMLTTKRIHFLHVCLFFSMGMSD